VLKKKKDGVVAFAKIEETYCLRETNLAIWFILLVFMCVSIMLFNIFTEYAHIEYAPTGNV
jgi:hypothetical protein